MELFLSPCDRLGVTMHPAQPDRTFFGDCRQILLQKAIREISFLHLQGKAA